MTYDELDQAKNLLLTLTARILAVTCLVGAVPLVRCRATN